MTDVVFSAQDKKNANQASEDPQQTEDKEKSADPPRIERTRSGRKKSQPAAEEKKKAEAKMKARQNLRKFNKLLEPDKVRQICLLSTLHRSRSFDWSPKEKRTIDNLWRDPNKPKFQIGQSRLMPALTKQGAQPALNPTRQTNFQMRRQQTRRDPQEMTNKSSKQKTDDHQRKKLRQASSLQQQLPSADSVESIQMSSQTFESQATAMLQKNPSSPDQMRSTPRSKPKQKSRKHQQRDAKMKKNPTEGSLQLSEEQPEQQLSKQRSQRRQKSKQNIKQVQQQLHVVQEMSQPLHQSQPLQPQLEYVEEYVDQPPDQYEPSYQSQEHVGLPQGQPESPQTQQEYLSLLPDQPEQSQSQQEYMSQPPDQLDSPQSQQEYLNLPPDRLDAQQTQQEYVSLPADLSEPSQWAPAPVTLQNNTQPETHGQNERRGRNANLSHLSATEPAMPSQQPILAPPQPVGNFSPQIPPAAQQQRSPASQQQLAATPQQQCSPAHQQYFSPAPQQQPSPAAQQQSFTHMAQQQSFIAVQQQRGPAVQQQHGPVVQQQRGPAVQYQHSPAAQQQHSPAAQQQQNTLAQQQQNTVAQQYNTPTTQQQRSPVAQQYRSPQQLPMASPIPKQNANINIQLRNALEPVAEERKDDERVRPKEKTKSQPPRVKKAAKIPPAARAAQQSSLSSSNNFFTSSEEEESIDPALYDAFVSHDDLQEELDALRAELQQQVVEDAGPIILAELDQVVESTVAAATKTSAKRLKQQLKESAEEIKKTLSNEVGIIKRMTEYIKTTMFPDNLKQVEAQLKEGKEQNKIALDACLDECATQIQKFAERVDYFHIEVSSAMTKFSRLAADQDLFRSNTTKIHKRTRDMVKVIRAEQLASSKIMSTLVELEFMQQSLDFQDEFDKTEMHLYGLNDLNMTLDEFIAKSGEIAHRKVRHEALQQATQLELQQLGEGNFKRDFFEISDSGAYQAIEMGDKWPQQLNNESMKKQIHQAFKMACIYYKPSPVLYRGHQYNRRALIEAKRSILDAEWQLILKFQPFKRLWGDDSKCDFFEQFANKIHTVIQNKKKGMDVAKILEDSTDETFVKIMDGHRLDDVQYRKRLDDEMMMGSDYCLNFDILSSPGSERSPRDWQILDLNQDKAGVFTEPHSALKTQPGRNQPDSREESRLQNQVKGTGVKIKRRQHNEEDAVTNTIDSRTRSMLNALQGISLIARSPEESLFSNEDVDKANTSKNRQPIFNKRQQTRSVQQKLEKVVGPGILNDSSNQNTNALTQTTGINEKEPHDQDNDVLKASQATQDDNASIDKLVRNMQAQQNRQYFTTQYQSQRAFGSRKEQLNSDNPLIEMRPLIGKEQQPQSRCKQRKIRDPEGAESQNFDATEYDMRNSALQFTHPRVSSQFAPASPWGRAGQQAQRPRAARKTSYKNNKFLVPLDMTVIGKKEETLNSSRLLLEKNMPSVRSTFKIASNQISGLPQSNIHIPQPITHACTQTIQDTPDKSFRQPGGRKFKEINLHLNTLSDTMFTMPHAAICQTQRASTKMAKHHLNSGRKRKMPDPSHKKKSAMIEFAVTQGNRELDSRDVAYQVGINNLHQLQLNESSDGPRERMKSENSDQSGERDSSPSMCCTQENELEGKMQAKLALTASAGGFGNNRSSGCGSNSTAVNTQKLKDIAMQKKQRQRMATGGLTEKPQKSIEIQPQ